MDTRLGYAVVAGALALGIGIHAQQMGARQDTSKPGMATAQGMKDVTMTRGFMPFSKEAFAQVTASGKTTLVFFHAPWCPVCKAQEPKVLAHLNGDAKDVVAFKADYDSNTDLRKEMKVEKQSTLILYSGTREVARLAYTSDDAAIDDLFEHATTMKKGME